MEELYKGDLSLFQKKNHNGSCPYYPGRSAKTSVTRLGRFIARAGIIYWQFHEEADLNFTARGDGSIGQCLETIVGNCQIINLMPIFPRNIFVYWASTETAVWTRDLRHSEALSPSADKVYDCKSHTDVLESWIHFSHIIDKIPQWTEVVHKMSSALRKTVFA